MEIETTNTTCPRGNDFFSMSASAPLSETNTDTQNSRTLTATFLMTDVEGSTRLWEEYALQMQKALARHDAIAEKLLSENNGRLVKSRGEGDSLFCVFTSPVDAVNAAWALQQAFQTENWPEETRLKVRMAVHTGDAEFRERDYYGPVINRCARLRSIAHGGQVLISSSTFAMVEQHVATPLFLRDMGLHHLKDLQQPEHVWQLCHPEFISEFPPLKSLNVQQTNLPQQVTTFVGRDTELVRLHSMLEKARMVTITGSGGVGKTRMTLQMGAEVQEQFTDGVWLIELAAIADAGLVAKTIANTLNVREEPGQPMQQSLENALREKSMLLILDNCEHLLAECSRVLNGLLRVCPKVKVLASSREGLGIQGEMLFRIPSLSVPMQGESPSPAALMQYEGVRLFVDRVQAVLPAFVVDETNAKPLAQICSRLDGIPFALELAAARVRAMSVDQLAVRLSDRFRILTGGSRTALPRQQTLRALIDWSYNLLSEQEQILLGRLSVFSGGWQLEDAEAICTGDPIEDWEVLDLLTSLVDKSIVVFEDRSQAGRYRLMESIRQYSLERMANNEQHADFRLRHAVHYLSRAQEWNKAIEQFGENQQTALLHLGQELNNLRSAMDWVAEQNQAESMAAYALALSRFFLMTASYTEGTQRLDTAIAAAHTVNMESEQAEMLMQRGRFAFYMADNQGARQYYTESLQLFQKMSNLKRQIPLLNNLGNVAWADGDFEAAENFYNQALMLAREEKLAAYEGTMLSNLGALASDKGEFVKCMQRFEEAINLHRKNDNARLYAEALMNYAEALRRQKEAGSAVKRLQESLEIFLNLGLKQQSGICSLYLAGALMDLNELEQAESCIQDGLQQAREIEDLWGTTLGLSHLGQIEALRGNTVQAAAYFLQAVNYQQEHAPQNKQRLAELLHTAAELLHNDGSIEQQYLLLCAAIDLYGDSNSFTCTSAKALQHKWREQLGEEAAARLQQEVQTITPRTLLERF